MPLNRIYVTQEEIARSMYRRRKEDAFTTEDVMRLHWDRQGARAIDWARTIIKRMRAAGIVEAYKPTKALADGRRVLYRFTPEALAGWGLAE